MFGGLLRCPEDDCQVANQLQVAGGRVAEHNCDLVKRCRELVIPVGMD